VTAASVADSSRSASASVSIANPAPTLSSILPTALDAGSPDTTLTVTGAGFASQSAIAVNGTSLPTTFDSSTQLTAVIPAAQLDSAGTFPVTVVTPTPGGGTSNIANLAVQVVVGVSPLSQTLMVTQTQAFTATVKGSAEQGVTWGVNDVAGGDATLGTVDAGGLYTAPAAPPSPNTVTVKAASIADPTRWQSASVTVINPAPVITSVSPTTINAGNTDVTLTVVGEGFAQQSMAYFSGAAVTTIFDSPTQLSAVIPHAQLQTQGTYPLTVETPAPGGGTSGEFDVIVQVAVTVSPRTPTLSVNQTQAFVATVAGIANQSVTWSVNDVPGGDATVGTISPDGLYIAPGDIPASNPFIVKAESVADPTKSGNSTVTVSYPPADNYPRLGAGSILRTPPALTQVPATGDQFAVLDWTSKDGDGNEEDIIALCNTLSPLGIPHVHTTDVSVATGYPFLAIAGIFGSSLNNPERTALVNYVQNGGTLFLWGLTDSSLMASLGAGTADEQIGTTVRPLTFDVGTGDPALHYIDDTEEINWSMAYIGGALSWGYVPGSAQELATWENGEAAVLRSDLGSGRAYIFGWRARHVVTDAQLLRVPGVEPPWVNVPVLDADIQKMLLRGVYENVAGASAQLRQFAPDNKQAALIITHDVDDQTAYDLMAEFAQLEYDNAVTATFNMTTSPYFNGWIDGFYDAAGKQDIQAVLDLGHDVESHSFGHFDDFDLAPFGTGTETAANYLPQYSWDLAETLGFSTLGELGVSRWLLEDNFGITVENFRSGYLLISDDFLEALRQTGYRRDSTYAAGVTRGSFPFVPFTSDSSGVITTYPLVEYPMAMEDPVDLSADTVDQTVDLWYTVILRNYHNNAPTVLNLHPVDTAREAALAQLLQRIHDAGLDLWIGDWKTFGVFWEAQGVTCSKWP
jgi:peptidoglycan/xylan/chitin deacetylase (PgdA/CDA1 family)